jgi:hypothetical protein
MVGSEGIKPHFMKHFNEGEDEEHEERTRVKIFPSWRLERWKMLIKFHYNNLIGSLTQQD